MMKEISMAFNNFIMAVIKKLNLKISQPHLNWAEKLENPEILAVKR